ncbi:arginase family protein [Desulforhopalus singaporensis]|uniref:Acetoin utilization deacetylase AcuC n=1 Tax=Desulforhopalus singaporensis TaxID=91360 RepID=A0A1H0U354_9BACT|nr:acetylpolyamine aminohydrolase [Desulforhopalus singaporensis]SDP60697.1 Acetoin utilization deacetylase AcuC [Desulforhopalus singaporensis]
MKVFFHPRFYDQYTSDPVAETGRMEAIVLAIMDHVELCECMAATEGDLLAAHTHDHIERVRRHGLYEIAALAAGGAVQAAKAGMKEPSFALVRPPGHHASGDSCWGFCYFNNMAVALYRAKAEQLIEKAFILDFDMHYGDGNVNILEGESWVEILNPEAKNRGDYLDEVKYALENSRADIYAVSAGFDNHVNDWGGLLYRKDYRLMGQWVHHAARRGQGGCFGILEGGYNHSVLGGNVLAFLEGMKR